MRQACPAPMPGRNWPTRRAWAVKPAEPFPPTPPRAMRPRIPLPPRHDRGEGGRDWPIRPRPRWFGPALPGPTPPARKLPTASQPPATGPGCRSALSGQRRAGSANRRGLWPAGPSAAVRVAATRPTTTRRAAGPPCGCRRAAQRFRPGKRYRSGKDRALGQGWPCRLAAPCVGARRHGARRGVDTVNNPQGFPAEAATAPLPNALSGLCRLREGGMSRR